MPLFFESLAARRRLLPKKTEELDELPNWHNTTRQPDRNTTSNGSRESNRMSSAKMSERAQTRINEPFRNIEDNKRSISRLQSVNLDNLPTENSSEIPIVFQDGNALKEPSLSGLRRSSITHVRVMGFPQTSKSSIKPMDMSSDIGGTKRSKKISVSQNQNEAFTNIVDPKQPIIRSHSSDLNNLPMENTSEIPIVFQDPDVFKRSLSPALTQPLVTKVRVMRVPRASKASMKQTEISSDIGGTKQVRKVPDNALNQKVKQGLDANAKLGVYITHIKPLKQVKSVDRLDYKSHRSMSDC